MNKDYNPETIEEVIIKKPVGVIGVIWALLGTTFLIFGILSISVLKLIGGMMFLVLAYFTTLKDK